MRSLLSASGLAAATQPMLEAFASGLAAPAGLSPAQIRHAYGFDAVGGNGAGQTIAIVDAYDDPNVASDLYTFDRQFGLPDPSFSKVMMLSAKGDLPAADRGWASEIALDVEWAHAIAPAANILLVEANTSSYTDMLAAVDYARNCYGVSVVSMSWGGGEFGSETSCDTHFTTPAGHANVTFVASSGDDGAGVSYPAASPNVLAVGGTSLTLKSGNYSSESAWSGSGGGVSRAEPEPSWQRSLQSYGTRTVPDVAFDANPSTGVSVYDSYGSGGWAVYGGTSISAPQWAGLIAIVNQGRATPLKNAISDLYSLAKTSPGDFHDISSGSNGYRVTTGYDLATGLGSPVANKLIADLIRSADSAPAPSSSGTGSLKTGAASWGRWSEPLSPPGGSDAQITAVSLLPWQSSLDVAANGAAANGYLSTPMSAGFLSLRRGADVDSATDAMLSASLFRSGDFGSGLLGPVSALWENSLNRDATQTLSLANSTAAAALPADSVRVDASSPVSAEHDRPLAVPTSDLPAAAVDCCYDEDGLGAEHADALVRVDMAEATGASRATALAVIPLIFSRFEEEAAIGRAETRKRWPLAAREPR
jgi:hypothetical protein